MLPIPAVQGEAYGYNDPLTVPPGTLGRTYQRPVRMIPHDKHPRIGMLDVEIIDSMRAGIAPDVKIKVIVRDMYNHFAPLKGYLGDDNVWHFESEPLLPSVPQIFDVRVELIREREEVERKYGREFIRNVEDKLGTLAVSRVRLIPGRIADLVIY